jgi:hypothetical protein
MKKNRSILVITMISFFTVTMLFFLGLSEVAGGKPEKPDPTEPIMTMLDEIYDIVLDTNSKVTPATCTGAPVAKTGQTESYAAGDDGDSDKGMVWPTPRFTDNSNGTVTDNLTGLIWLKNANCPNGEIMWSDALTFANSLYDGWTGDGSGGDCGLSDGSSASEWRLSNVRELHSLIDFGNHNPALPSGHPFTGVQQNYYWSSTTYAGAAGTAWDVHIYHGYVLSSNKNSTIHYVWPVRGGQ